MKICIGKSRREKVWQNKEISWKEFTNIVKNTVRTSETMGNYKRFSKVEQDEIKDVGGFVGGHLKGGRRKKGNLTCRSFLTLDMAMEGKAFGRTYAKLLILNVAYTPLISTQKKNQDYV